MNDIITLFFAWPTGSVWSNLIASVIWALPSLVVILRKMSKYHDERMTKLDAIHTDVKAGNAAL